MFSIRNRFLIAMCILSSLASTVCLLFGAWLLFIQLKNTSLKSLNSGKETLESSIDYEFLKLSSDTKILAGLSEFIKEIESRQNLAVLKIAQKFQEQSQLSDVSSYDNDGNPITTEKENNEFKFINFFSEKKNSPLFQNFKDAQMGKPSSKLFSDNNIKFIHISPVISNNKKVCGILTTSVNLNNKFAEKISRLTGVDISFFAKDKLISTSLQDNEDKKDINNEYKKNIINKVDNEKSWISNNSYYLLVAMSKDLSDDKIYALLSISNKENIYVFEYVKNFIIAFGIFIIISSFIVATFLSSGITRGIKKLEKNAAALASGKLDTFIDTKGKDEIGKLAKNFDSMRQSINHLVFNLKETNASYQRFVPREFIEILNKDDIIRVKLGDCLQIKMTVLFSDIRDFTSMSEQMSPQDNFDFINSYLKFVAPIIKKQGGFIDKYIGDAVMALFPNHANHALIAACEMREGLKKINEERLEQGKNILKIGIGLNTGTVIIGIVGEEQRIDATVIGDAVNIASRVESMTKSLGTTILMTNETFQSLDDNQKKGIEYIGEHKIKGKSEVIKLYKVN